jgi:hypothetical protein
MCGYDKYVHLDFEIVLNSLGAGMDMQISEDDSLRKLRGVKYSENVSRWQK